MDGIAQTEISLCDISISLQRIIKDLKFQHHMGREHASREKKLTMVDFFIFVHKNVYRIRFQEIKIRPLKGFEKMHFLCFYIIGV